MLDPDPACIRRARGGDPRAFAELVRHYQDRVYGLAYRLTYDAELARDIAQDVFLRLFEKLDRYDPARPFTPWFLRLATNYALNARQKARLRWTHSLDAPLLDGERAPEPKDPEAVQSQALAEESEARAAIHAAIRELPEKYAGVVALHYLEGLSVAAIGERLDLPSGTVKVRLHRARQRLREALRPYASPGE